MSLCLARGGLAGVVLPSIFTAFESDEFSSAASFNKGEVKKSFT